MKNLFLKFLYLIASVNHPHIRKEYRYFIRDNYHSRIFQLKYRIKDYLKKEKYKVIEFQGEFQQELTFVIPFAYWHYLNGTLKTTISSKNTKDFYFFSQDHREIHDKRIWQLNHSNSEIPNMTHSVSFSYKKWAQIPFKDHYRNSVFIYEKPILVIANKYNIEWDNQPINYFDIGMLDWMIKSYSQKYQIIYNRPLPSQIVDDNSEILDLNEHVWLKQNHPEVIQLNDLYNNNKGAVNSFNHLQLLIYANCNHFISVHGGTAALASYFGGTNIIFSKRGIEHELGEFQTIFPALSNATIFHAKTEEDIKIFMKSHY